MSDKKKQVTVPEPAHPIHRRTRLPWEVRKPSSDDASCEERIDAIMESPSYLPAIEDVNFLASGDARTVRLQLDYLKPERLMRRHGIKHAIVVFGSTRIVEPKVAKKRVSDLEAAISNCPGNEDLEGELAIARRIEANSRFYDIAREFAQLVARSGSGAGDSTLVVMTGGGPGMMEAANRGASDVGAETVGLNITLPHEQFPNPYLTPDLCFQFHYFAMRKMHFMLRARALVAFPGGFGTFDELFETLTLVQTRKIKPLPVVLVGEEFWRRAFDVDFMVEEGVIDAEDRDLFWYAETAEEIWSSLQLWYQRAGEPLITDS